MVHKYMAENMTSDNYCERNVRLGTGKENKLTIDAVLDQH